MTVVMKHAQWLKMTDGGLLQTRSAALKAVDAALLRYEQSSNLHNWDDLQKAVIQYLGTKGANWKTDKRNRFGALTTLYEQVMRIGGPAKTGGAMVGLSHVRDESRAILDTLFRGKRLEWRPGILAKFDIKTKAERGMAANTVRGIVKNANTVSGGAVLQGVRSGIGPVGLGDGSNAQAVARLLREIVPSDVFPEVSALLSVQMPETLAELGAACAPFAGVIVSAGSVAVGCVQAVRAEIALDDMREMRLRSMAISTGESAIGGMARVLDRECNRIEADLAINTAALGTKLALVLADGGTASTAAVGLAAQLGKILLKIQRLVRDVLEQRAVNRLLLDPKALDIGVFETSPILGAYLVGCAPTSVMVDTVFSRFYDRGWMGEVEQYVATDLGRLQSSARTLVQEHRFWIPSLQRFPGLMAVNSDALKKMRDNVGKSGMVGFGSATPVTQLPPEMQQAMLRDAQRGIKPPPLPPRPRRP